MRSRAELKLRAKRFLTGGYWLAFAVCLVCGLLTGRLNSIFTLQHKFSSLNSGNLDLGNSAFYVILAGILTTVFLIALLAGLAYRFFIAYPLIVGQSKYFLESRKNHREFSDLFSTFKRGRYLNVVKGMAWRYLFNFLWYLLFIVPGIVKSYAYSMVPYILADNPNIGYKRALNLSMNMTYGHKGKIFVLQLSFIGWYLLGLLCCIVGVLFVVPYYQASFTEMYAELRKIAVKNGICTAAELNMTGKDYSLDYPQPGNPQ